MPPRPARRIFLPKIARRRKERRAEADRARRNPFSNIRHAGNRPSGSTAGAKCRKERCAEADRARRNPFSNIRHARNRPSESTAGAKCKKERRAEADRARRDPFSNIRHAGNRPSGSTAGAKCRKERRTAAREKAIRRKRIRTSEKHARLTFRARFFLFPLPHSAAPKRSLFY